LATPGKTIRQIDDVKKANRLESMICFFMRIPINLAIRAELPITSYENRIENIYN
jgi:hypothetical protein